MSDYDAVLAVLEEKLAQAEAFVAAGGSFDPVIGAAVTYAGATVAHRQAYLTRCESDYRREMDDAQEAAWVALAAAVVATLGPSE